MTKYDYTVILEKLTDYILFKFRICLKRIGLNNIFLVKKKKIQILFYTK